MQADLEFVKLIAEIEQEMIEYDEKLAKAILAELKERDENEHGFHPPVDCSKLKCVQEYEMARKPRKSKKESNVSSLIEALKFLSLNQSKTGSDEEVCCSIVNNKAVVNNGNISMGIDIVEDLEACPQTHKFISVLEQCTGEVKITQLNKDVLSIQSDGFNFDVPCLEDFECEAQPDEFLGDITNEVLEAFKCVSKLLNKSAEQYIFKSALLQSGSCVGTDGSAIIEYWHGLHLPTKLIPKEAIDVVLKCKKNLKAFGFSDSTFTFYFEDDSWIKTNTIEKQYIDYASLLNVGANPYPLSETLTQAIDKLLAVSNDNIINFEGNAVSINDGSKFNFENLPTDIAFDGSYFLNLKEYINSADFNVPEQHCLFFGDKTRGIIKAIEL